MPDLIALYKSKLRGFLNQASQQLYENKLKVTVISISAIVLWAVIFIFFYRSLIFLRTFEEIGNIVVIYFLGLFFFALGIMLVISNAIINYSSLYRSSESAYLFSLPVPAGKIFIYRITESLLFSSWAFLFLGSPFLIALGIHYSSGWTYYLYLVLFSAVFIILPALVGGLISIIIARFLPHRQKTVLILSIAVIFLIGVCFVSEITRLEGRTITFIISGMKDFLERLSFAQNPILPSHWITRGILSATSDASESPFFFLLLLSWALFLGLLSYQTASLFYLDGYSLVASSTRSKNYPAVSYFDRVSSIILRFLSPASRLIVIKDIKTLFRDPSQWSQMLIFFGLLTIYFINIKNVPYINLREGMWQYLVSSLNLLATTLTLATFTTRFIYPQISLEGRKFWIIGMMPIRRKEIFYSKFIFALSGAIIITLPLIFISSYQVEVPSGMMFQQLYFGLIICLGLSSIAVSVGVLYPNFKEDNPSKIISGFGGTLCLVLSLLYLLTIVVIGSIPGHLYYVLGRINSNTFSILQIISTVLISFGAVIVTIISIRFGLKSIERIEI
jgi:ABC-2 type transport system permease protein